MKASDVMNRKVVFLFQEATLDEAARRMLECHVSGLPVVDERGKVVGVITEGDLMRRVETGTTRRVSRLAAFLRPGSVAQEYVRTHARRVRELLSGEIIAVSPDASIAEVVATMESRRVRRVLVLEHERVVGIIARADLLKGLVKLLPSAIESPAVSDAQIRAQFLKEVGEQPWTSEVVIDAVVREHVIELHGVIMDERMRTALRVIAENIHGVRNVVDHIACVEPFMGTLVSQGSDMPRTAA